MKDSAAAFAASMRLGRISVEHMLREASIARMTVVSVVGMVTIATGRVSASIRLESAVRNKAKGKWRRKRECLGSASRTSDRLEYRTVKRLRRRKIQI